MLMSQRKRIIIIASIVIVFIILPILIYVLVSGKNTYGDSISISNLSSFTKGQPTNQERIDFIQYNLFNVINMNVKKPIKSNSLSDAKVRDGSFLQTDNDIDNSHEVTFIIDIESIKQSYGASYQWSDAKNISNNEYGTQVTCLPIDELKYGDFNCIDERIEEKGRENYDPIQNILPHTVQYKYTIKSYSKQSNSYITVDVEAFIPKWSNPDETINQYTTEIKEWIRSKKLDPEKYRFNYIY